jgi:hypothetical protein
VQIIKEYVLQLAMVASSNRDAYTEAKTDFICKWTAETGRIYGERS